MTAQAAALSVIIVNWNGGDLLLSCLRSLREAIEGLPAEVWLVDNASSDGSAESAARELPTVRLIRNSENLGFARAANQALAAASGELLLLLNPDVQIDRPALARMMATMESDRRIGIAGCPSVDDDGRVAPGYELSYPGKRARAVGSGNGGVERDVAWVSGACLMARREILAAIGPLDPGFFMYYEDVDWCYRARAAGWRVVTRPDVLVAHKLGGSSAQVSSAETERRVVASRIRFYRKHHSPGRAQLLAARVALCAAPSFAWHLVPALFSGAFRQALRADCARIGAAVAGALHTANGSDTE